jgi:hypothetical protein
MSNLPYITLTCCRTAHLLTSRLPQLTKLPLPPIPIPSTMSSSRLKSAASALTSSSVEAASRVVLLVDVETWVVKVEVDSTPVGEALLLAVVVLPRRRRPGLTALATFSFSPPTSLPRLRCI